MEDGLTDILTLALPPLSIRSRIARKLLGRLHLDPLVKYQIGAVEFDVPLSHELPRFRARYPRYGDNQADVARHVLSKYPELCAVDVGANVGDTVAFWRTVGQFPVLAIEPTDKFGNVLARNSRRLGSVVIDRSMLGHVDADQTARLSIRRGTARLLSARSSSSIARLSSVIARYPGFDNAKLLKIDTDGSDGAVVVGAHEWLARRRPIVFFEFQPTLSRPGTPTLLDAFDVLAGIGYAQLVFYDNAGHFALSTSMLERDRVCELHAHAAGWGEERYWDVAAFHADDLDVYEALRGEELRRG